MSENDNTFNGRLYAVGYNPSNQCASSSSPVSTRTNLTAILPVMAIACLLIIISRQ
ncbi:MAG: hypothetical protein PHF64_11360 [Methanoregula sp.]|nr:hypothetical protein [Methanoregula sp.]